MVFRNQKALGCSDLNIVNTLQRAWGLLNTINPIGRGVLNRLHCSN